MLACVAPAAWFRLLTNTHNTHNDCHLSSKSVRYWV
jgi:hypothetical protein